MNTTLHPHRTATRLGLGVATFALLLGAAACSAEGSPADVPAGHGGGSENTGLRQDLGDKKTPPDALP